MRGKIFLAGLLCSTAMAVSTQAVAQEESGTGQRVNNEIIVTAQRRSQNLQDVPLAVTALSSRALDNAGVTEMSQLEALTPGLIMPRQLRASTPYMRGVGSQSSVAGVESPVATYVDGVYFMSTTGNIFSFNNIERVEILKGPQGTLFGRNATGGLLNVITRTPDATPSVEGRISYANYDTVEGALYASGGSDEIAASIALQGKHQGKGFGRYINQADRGDANFDRNFGVMGKVLWTPSDDDKLTLSFDLMKSTSDLGVSNNIAKDAVQRGGTRYAGTPWDNLSDVASDVSVKSYGGSVRYERDLGALGLTLTSAYRKMDSSLYFDLDRSPINLLVLDIAESTETFQQEMLLVGKTGRLDYTLGLFYFNASTEYDPLETLGGIPAALGETFAKQDTQSYSAFAQGTYAVTDTTNFTAGLRYTLDKRQIAAERFTTEGNPSGAGVKLYSVQDDARYSKLTWRLALDQKLADDVMAYGSFSRGFKSGGFNTSAPTEPSVRPEVLDAYEIGLKSELFDRLLTLNLAGFYYDYSDIQLTRVVDGTSLLFNAAAAKIKGVELEARLSPPITTGSLDFTGSVAIQDGHYSSFEGGPLELARPAVCSPVPQTTGTPTGGYVTCPVDLSGNDTIRTPKLAFNIGASYRVPVGPGDLQFNVNYYYNDGFSWTPDNNLKQSSYDILNGDISYSFGSNRQYKIRVFGKNLTDSLYYFYQSRSSTGSSSGSADPRTYGVGFEFAF